jgi:hypothetical protein
VGRLGLRFDDHLNCLYLDSMPQAQIPTAGKTAAATERPALVDGPVCAPEAPRSAWVGCQYNGADQFFSVTGSWYRAN